MPTYQKAYFLRQLRQFAGWKEAERGAPSREPIAAGEATNGGPEALADDAIVYVDESLLVRESCFDPGSVVFESASAEWRAFCRDVLKFAVPDWEAESARVREILAAQKTDEPASGGTTGSVAS